VEEKVKTIVIQTLKIDESQFDEDLAAGDIPEWDSIRHVQLLQNIEAAFNVNFDISDAIAVEDVMDLYDIVRKYNAES